MVSKVFPYYRRWVTLVRIDQSAPKKTMLEMLGGEAGCQRLAQDFYSRVSGNSELKPLFPGKSVRCATEEFAAFLIQFLEGDEDQTQYRWWISLRESHARFKISESQRNTWLGLMTETIHSQPFDENIKQALVQFLDVTSATVIGQGEGEIDHLELRARWNHQTVLDQLVEHIKNGRDEEAIALAQPCRSYRPVFIGILARMIETGREPLIKFALSSIESDCDLAHGRFNGRTLLHHAVESDCLPVVQLLLENGADPNILDTGGHAPLYRTKGAEIATELIKAGADVDFAGGVNRSTALHQAARFGNLPFAQALLKAGANPKARDKKGLTPYDRAINCRKPEVAEFLSRHRFPN